MELLEKISLWAHVIAGALTLLAGPVAIFYNFRDLRRHRLAGKIFFYAMLVVCLTAVGSFLQRPDVVFLQFLLGISAMVFGGVMRGVRAMQFRKGAGVSIWDWVYMAVWVGFGVWMLGMAGYHLQMGTMIAFPVLFGLFGLGAVVDSIRSLRFYRRPGEVNSLDWYRLHVSSMLGAFTASTTAFTVNAAHFLPWYLQWFGPTLLLLPLQIYFGRKLRAPTKHAMAR